MQLNVTKEEAERYIEMYFKAYPKMKEFIDNANKEAIWNKRVITPFGQRRQEYGAYECFQKSAVYNAALRNASNVKVQSPTSTLGLVTFANLNMDLKPLGVKGTCTVYDSCEWESPIIVGAEAIEKTFYYMNDWPQTQFDWLDFSIGCEVEIGYNWGELETVHRGVTQSEVEEILRKLKNK